MDINNEIVEKFKQQQLIKNNMFSSTDYINWLTNFTLKNTNFTDEDWIYFPEKITKEDYENISNLHLMYDGISKYANKNYLYPTDCYFGNFYKIKFNNIGFEIGILQGQGTIFFCNRIPIENNQDFIDFNDIINNKKSNNLIAIESELNNLSILIISLYQNNVPIDIIKTTINNTLNDINFEQKKLIKRK